MPMTDGGRVRGKERGESRGRGLGSKSEQMISATYGRGQPGVRGSDMDRHT